MNNPSFERRSLAEGAQSIGQGLHDATSAARDMARESIDHLRSAAGDYLEQGRVKAQELGETVEARVRAEPTKALLIAAGIGFLLGAIWVRR